jgi:hypothetical protein
LPSSAEEGVLKLRGPGILVLAALGAAFFVLGSRSADTPADSAPLSAGPVPAAQEAALSLVGPAPAAGVVQVFKSPTCGCCSEWIRHLEENGFTVEARDIANMMAVKSELGIPGELGSCHTARIDGYLIEGHVPAQDIQRMLAERPEIRGIAVPGMPVGSPGMEVEGRPADRYDVVAFDAAGRTSVFASH